MPLFKQICALFQRQGVDGDIGGIQRNHPIKAVAESFIGVLGKTGDQVHIDSIKACIHRLMVAAQHIFPGVGTAAGPQDSIVHSLGIDAHSVRSVGPDGREFLCI